jgi:hypothetical protein
MANSNFIVHNGLTVGGLTIDAASGNITTTGVLNSTATGTTEYSGDLLVQGNLTVNGETITFTTNSISTTDSIFYLEPTPASGAHDSGFLTHWVYPDIGYGHIGLVHRDAKNSDGRFTFFTKCSTEPTGLEIPWTDANIQLANVRVWSSDVSQLRYRTDTGNVSVTGSYQQAGIKFTASSAPPTAYTNGYGDRWYDTSSDTLYMYTNDGSNSVWVDISAIPQNYQANATVQGSTLSISGAGSIGGNLTVSGTMLGTASQAKYADLAEMYLADGDYAAGTVVVFGGDFEITQSTKDHDTAVAGIISTDPAYLMNANFPIGSYLPVALTGRVPCRVQGPVAKGTVLVTGTTAGTAQAIDNTKFAPGVVLGKALESIGDASVQTIEVAVGRF